MAEAEYDERNDPNSPNYAPDEDLPPPEDDAGFDDPSEPRKRRKWPWVILVLILLLGLFALFVPTIAGIPAVRTFALEKINNQLNGQLEITDWSLSWTGNTEITGVRIVQNGAQILAARRMFTELSLLDIIKGNWDLGTTVVEDLTFDFKQYRDGSNNFQKLPKRPSSGGPVILPDLRGDVDVIFWGSITQADGTLITLDRSHVNGKFDSINGPITHDLDVTARIAGKAPGKLTAKGVADLFEAGQISAKQLAVDDTIELGDFTLDAVGALLPPDGPITTLKGLTSGKLQLKLQGKNDFYVQGDIESEDFAIGGPILGGDTLREKSLRLTLPETRYDLASGRLRTRQVGTQSQQIVLKMKQLGTIAFSANAPVPALANFVANRAPGGEGRMLVVADINLETANQLPRLLELPQGLRITSGVLHHDAEIVLDKSTARIKGQLNVSELGGVDAQRRELYAEPINLAFHGTSLGGEGAVPDLRDLQVTLSSGFANATGQGASLAQVSLNGSADLAKFRDQIGQFMDLGLRQLGGQVVFSVTTIGDLTKSDGKATIDANVTGTSLVYQGEHGDPINEPWARVIAKGELARGEEQFVDAINRAALTAQTGNEQNPTVDLQVLGDLVFPEPAPPSAAPGKPAVAAALGVTVPRFDIPRLNVKLPAAQQEFAPLLQPLRDRGLNFTQGTIDAKGVGSYDGATATFTSFNVATQGVTLRREAPNRQPVSVLTNYNATINLAGSVRNDDRGLDARFATLNWADTQKIFSINKTGNGDLLVQMSDEGRKINGQVQLAANLKTLNDILRAAGDRPVEAVAKTRAGELRQGELAGTLTFAPAEQNQTLLTGDLAVSRLSVTTNEKPIENEQVTLSLRVRANDALSSVSAQQVNVKSSFVNATVKDTELRLAGATPEAYVSPLDVVQKGALTWNVTDLPRAVSIMRAFMPESAPEEDEDLEEVGPTTRPVDQVAVRPLEVGSGTLKGSLRLDRSNDGITLTLDELIGQKIVLRRGKGRFGPEDVNLKLAALVRTHPAGPTTRPVADQIQEIRVSQLAGDVAVANIALSEPIVIRDPAGMTQASGGVKIDGQVRTLTDLLRTLEFLPSDAQDPFDGAYTVTQRLTTQQQTIGLAGQVNITNFIAGNFREKLVRLANDVQLDQAKKAMTIRNFALNLEESQALSLKATGTIADYNNERRFEKTQALLSYDASKLPDLIRPLLDEASQEYIRTLKLSGVVRDQPFIVEGMYPATAPAADADGKQRDPIQYVTARGRLAFERFEYDGLPGEKLEIPLMLDNGRLTIVNAEGKRYADPAKFSRGTFDPGGLQMLFAGNAIRFSSLRENHKLLDRVVVNRAIVERYLGKAHPLFTGTDEARGVLTVTINNLDKLPIGEALTKPRRREEGRAKVTMSLADLRLKTFFLGQVLGNLKLVKLEPDGTVRCAIPDAAFAIEKGVVNSNLGLDLGGTVLGFRDGSVRLSDKQILGMNMLVPKALIPALRDEPLVKEFITVPVAGSLARPQFDIIKAAIQSSGINNPLDLLKRLQQGEEGASGSDRIGSERPAPPERRAQETPPQPPPREREPAREPRRPRGRQPR